MQDNTRGEIDILKIFKRQRHKAAVFIDYEHWYIALDKSFHIRPNIKDFFNRINAEFDISEMTFFGDFSNASLNSEMHKIRAFTNKIVETHNGTGHYKKDFTDFIMLDHIYRTAFTHKDIDTYIIFTGDGHFSSAVLFLKQTCKKNVIVYGVKNAFSGQLKQTANSWHEIPSHEDEILPYKRMVLSSLYELACEHEKPRASFVKTVENVAARFNADGALVKKALEELIEKGYVVQYASKIGNKNVRLLRADFEKAKQDGIYTPGYTVKPF